MQSLLFSKRKPCQPKLFTHQGHLLEQNKKDFFISETKRPTARLMESHASVGHCSICKLICAFNICNIHVLTVSVHLSSTPSIRSPGSATVFHILRQTSLNWLVPKIMAYVFSRMLYTGKRTVKVSFKFYTHEACI